ncbi:MAG: hypothetical protein ACW986_11400 [Promethearchaeota archaeon]|jgi:hypothetical protein
MVNLIFDFSVASDDDDDGIDDNFEGIHKRNITIEFLDNETKVESILRNGANIDEIEFNIKYDDDGLAIEISYEEEFDSGSEKELEFEVVFHELVEYIDINNNSLYEPSIDQTIQSVLIDQFSNITYSNSSTSDNSTLHYFRVKTTDNVFIAHISIAEEFEIVNETLINPTQIKIDIEIDNFNYLNGSSNLALYTMLNSEEGYEQDDETYDEEKEYALSEKGVITSLNTFTGFFSWKENASIDGISKRILVSEIDVDDHNETEQKLYINYPRGNNIYHDPKIGIEGLFPSDIAPFPLTLIIILVIIIGSVSASVVYALTYIQKSKHRKPVYDDSDPTLALRILREEDSIKKLSQLGDTNITAFSKSFLERINKFDWDENEKAEFMEEMREFSPEERNAVLNEMERKSKVA